MKPKIMANYYCKYCNKVILRVSTKEWIKSYCDNSSKNARMMKVRDTDAIILKNQFGDWNIIRINHSKTDSRKSITKAKKFCKEMGFRILNVIRDKNEL